MTQEEANLLFKDICGRLPYMPKIKIIYQQQGIKGIDEVNVSCDFIEKIVNDLRNGIIFLTVWSLILTVLTVITSTNVFF